MKAWAVVLLAGLIGGLVMYAYATEDQAMAAVPTRVEHVSVSPETGWAATGYALYTD